MTWFKSGGIMGPKTGTWQLKTTTGKKYIIIGTDDDNAGNAKFFRLLRTYNFPYTMNVEAESMDVELPGDKRGPKPLGSDVDDNIFGPTDAPALFPNGVNVLQLGTYLKEHNKGEVAQHGGSDYTLWDSSKLTGSFLDGLYATYTTEGGTKTEAELKEAILEAKAASDVQQGAPYVLSSHKVLERYYNFAINTVGIWGGEPKVTIDDIELNLNSIKGWSGYPWRVNGYKAASTVLGQGVEVNTTPYNISRQLDQTEAAALEHLGQISPGCAHEFFWHAPFTDIGNTALRNLFTAIAALVTAGRAEVVTREQYEALGEYVANPVVSITASRADITVGDPDSKSEYHVTATYADGTTADVSSSAVIFNENVDTSAAGTYQVPINYLNKNVTISVVVTSGGSASVDLHFVYTGRINGNTGEYYTNSSDTTYFASSELVEYDSTKTYYVTFSGTTSNSGTRPKLQDLYCYDSNGDYLGHVGLSDLQGRVTDAPLPDLTQSYATTAYFRIQGRVNATYSTSQTNDWSCVKS